MGLEVQHETYTYSQEELIQLGVQPSEEYSNVYLGVYKKFIGGLKASILDKDDVMSLCHIMYLSASQKYASKVQNGGYVGDFTSYLYVCCVNYIYQEVNSNKRGFRLTKYALSKMLQQSNEVMGNISLLTTEDYLRSSVEKLNINSSVQALTLIDVEEVTEHHHTSSDTEFIDSLCTYADNELEEKLLVFKYHQYTNEEISKLLGVSPKYVSKKWVALKDKLKRRLNNIDFSL